MLTALVIAALTVGVVAALRPRRHRRPGPSAGGDGGDGLPWASGSDAADSSDDGGGCDDGGGDGGGDGGSCD